MATRDDHSGSGFRDGDDCGVAVDDAPPALVSAARGEDAAAYLLDMLPELSAIAERSGMDLAAYLLTMARLEVEDERRRNRF